MSHIKDVNAISWKLKNFIQKRQNEILSENNISLDFEPIPTVKSFESNFLYPIYKEENISNNRKYYSLNSNGWSDSISRQESEKNFDDLSDEFLGTETARKFETSENILTKSPFPIETQKFDINGNSLIQNEISTKEVNSMNPFVGSSMFNYETNQEGNSWSIAEDIIDNPSIGNENSINSINPNTKILERFKLFARYSKITWCKNSGTKYFNKNVLGNVFFEPKNDEIAVILAGKDQNASQMLANNTYLEYPGKIGFHVNRALYETYVGAENKIIEQLSQLLNSDPKSPINLAGWSLGGAFAVFAAIFINIKFPNNQVNVYTYGQPRIGLKNFKTYLSSRKNLRIYRMTTKNDPFVDLPMRFPLGYVHTGQEYLTSTINKMETFECPDGPNSENTVFDVFWNF
ncbi:hypothetical protein G9A89_006761 [Geosiphon pyriformis]|nr:hypothetical protein G9A89_006761 [Geosiphon pyriformis]